MLETAGGSCFRASNDLAGATTRRWCWQHRWYARSASSALMLAGFIRADNDRELDFHRSRDSPRVDDRLSAAWSPRPSRIPTKNPRLLRSLFDVSEANVSTNIRIVSFCTSSITWNFSNFRDTFFLFFFDFVAFLLWTLTNRFNSLGEFLIFWKNWIR